VYCYFSWHRWQRILILYNIGLHFCPCYVLQKYCKRSWFRWPRGLRCGSLAACLVGLWVGIPLGARISVSCECCVLSGRGLCIGPITCPECYWVRFVWVRSWSLDNKEAPAQWGLLHHGVWGVVLQMSILPSWINVACAWRLRDINL